MNRGRGDANTFQDTFDVNLKSGSNLLMVKVSERAGGWGMYVGVMPNSPSVARRVLCLLNLPEN